MVFLSFQENLAFSWENLTNTPFLFCSLVHHRCLRDTAWWGEGVCFMEVVVRAFASIVDSQDPMIMCCSIIESQTL